MGNQFEQSSQTSPASGQATEKKPELNHEQIIQRLSELGGLTIDEVQEIVALQQKWGRGEWKIFEPKRLIELEMKAIDHPADYKEAEQKFKNLSNRVKVALNRFEEQYNIVGLNTVDMGFFTVLFNRKRNRQYDMAIENAKFLPDEVLLDHQRLCLLVDGQIFER